MNTLNVNIDIRLDVNTRHAEQFEQTIIVKNEDNSNYDFTGHVVEWVWLKNLTDVTPDLVFNNADGLVLAPGQIQLNKNSTKMSIRPGEYFHFLKITNASGVKKTWLNGIALLNNGLFSGNPSTPPTLIIGANGTPLTLTIQSATVTLANIRAALDTLNPAEGDVLQFRGGVWTNRTLQQLYNDLLPFIVNP